MLEVNNKTNCCGCFACKNICPRNAISMIEDEKGFKYPKINYNYCINCGLCKKVCPIINNKKESDVLPVSSYAAFNNNEKVRMNSSSGGLFSLIAEYIIKNNGVVFGAIFDDDFLVKHIKAETLPEIEKIRGSKYIQSDIGKTYNEARQALNQGRLVLFTGTPCQIEGLKTYLMKDYENLYTQDIICHGVPSNKVWKKYLEYRKLDNDILENVSFRNKENKGWNKYQLLFEYKNSKTYIDHIDDLYMKIFLSDIALRDSCYDCKFKKKHRISDITLADFWGINDLLPEMNDEKGTSLLIVNSEKGRKLLDNIKDKIKIKEVDFEKAICKNPSMIKSPKLKENREKFFKDLESNMSIEELTNKYIEEA